MTAGLVALGSPASAAPAPVATDPVTVTSPEFEFFGLDEAPDVALSLPRFDPSLGTLIEVRYELSGTAVQQLCLENLSPNGGQQSAEGSAWAEVIVEVPGLPALQTRDEIAVSGPVEAGNGMANSACIAAFDWGYAAPVSAPNLRYAESGGAPFTESGSITTGLDDFIGTEPLSVHYGGDAGVSTHSGGEWVSRYWAFGAMSATITYVYAPPAAPTTTPPTTVAPTTVPPATEPPDTTVAATTEPVTTVAGVPTTTPPTPTTPPGTLPSTGSDSNGIVMLAGGLSLAGVVAVSYAEIRRRRTA